MKLCHGSHCMFSAVNPTRGSRQGTYPWRSGRPSPVIRDLIDDLCHDGIRDAITSRRHVTGNRLQSLAKGFLKLWDMNQLSTTGQVFFLCTCCFIRSSRSNKHNVGKTIGQNPLLSAESIQSHWAQKHVHSFSGYTSTLAVYPKKLVSLEKRALQPRIA